MSQILPRSWPDQEHLGVLACGFRSTRDVAQRQAIAREYAETVTRLIESGNWHEAPSPEDWLPYDWMPREFFAYWMSPEAPRPAALPAHPEVTGTAEKSISEPLITSNPAVMLGKPVIAGTRITVESVLEKLGGGDSIDDLLRDYPHVSREGILAALRYARDVMAVSARAASTWQDQEYLGVLAMRFRSTRDIAERQAISREYADAVARLIASGNWHEMPSLEDQLPDESMPREFFAYWMSPDGAPDQDTAGSP